jgi:acyl-CoA thioesterase FadM
MARVKLQIPTNLPFHTEIPIRIYDINYGGHLGNDAILSIVHEARVQFLQSLGYTELDIEGTGIMMTDAVITYISEGFYGDVLEVEVGVMDFQSANCDFVFRLTNKATGKEVVRAKIGITFINRQTRKISPVPDSFRKKCNTVSVSPFNRS